MLLVVNDLLLDLKIADGTRQVVEVVGENGGGEEQGKANAVLFEYVGGRKCVHVAGNGLHRVDVSVALSADHAIGLAINLGNADNDVGEARPVGRVNVGQLVCGRPDVEKGIDRDQRYCGGTKSHSDSPCSMYFRFWILVFADAPHGRCVPLEIYCSTFPARLSRAERSFSKFLGKWMGRMKSFVDAVRDELGEGRPPRSHHVLSLHSLFQK